MGSLEWLAATALMTALFWVPYATERMVSLGILGALKPLTPEAEARQAMWAQRARQIHYNAIENLVVFSTLVLIAYAVGKVAEHTVLISAQLYFWARLVHFFAGTFAVIGVRSLAFFVGVGCQVAVAVEIFS